MWQRFRSIDNTTGMEGAFVVLAFVTTGEKRLTLQAPPLFPVLPAEALELALGPAPPGAASFGNRLASSSQTDC